MEIERGKSFPVSAIWIDRSTRQRKELTQIDELASSIQRTGHLIHPITIRKSGELVAGERRYTAVKQLGWTAIDVQFVEDLNESELKLLELEENVARVDLSWQDQCQAISQYHTIRSTQDPEWTTARTAEALNISPRSLNEKLSVATELATGNSMVAEAPKYSTARGIVTRAAERKKFTGLLKVEHSINPVKATEIAKKHSEVPLLNIDFASWLDTYTGDPGFNFIHCDFPYGVGMHKSDQGGGAAYGTYEDTPDIYWELIAQLKRAMSICVSPSAHLMFWFSMDYYQSTKEALESMGWKVNPFPLIWYKSDNTGILPDAQRGPRRIYETAFIASRGDRLIVRATSNATLAGGSSDKNIHMNQKNHQMLLYFFNMFVDNSTIMLDPTCGSASAVKAAAKRGAAKVLGLEKSQEFFARAVDAYHDTES